MLKRRVTIMSMAGAAVAIVAAVTVTSLTVGDTSTESSGVSTDMAGQAPLNKQIIDTPVQAVQPPSSNTQSQATNGESVPAPVSSQLEALKKLDSSATEDDFANSNLNVNFTPEHNYTLTETTGDLEISSDKLPIKFDNSFLANMSTQYGTMWFGPIHGQLTLPSGQEVGVILGVDFVPTANMYQSTLTIESLGTPIHLTFGNGFVGK